MNTCGTYGVASAQFYWGRLVGLIHRVALNLFQLLAWLFTYVDDLYGLVPLCDLWAAGAAFILFLMAVGFPISWKKAKNWHPNNVDRFVVRFTISHNSPIR